MSDALQRRKTLGQAIAECIQKHGKCTLWSNPEDDGVIKVDRPTQDAITWLVARGMLELQQSRYVKPGDVLVMAPMPDAFWWR